MKLDFGKVIVTGVDGKVIDNDNQLKLHQLLGNLIYTKTNDLNMLELAQKIYKGVPVELREEEVKEIRRVINENFLAFVRKPVMDYLDRQMTDKE